MADTDDADVAISAVVDDVFIAGEAEDDDYDDLYNDVNACENSLNSLNHSADVASIQLQEPGNPPVVVSEKEEDTEREDEVKKPEDRVADVASMGIVNVGPVNKPEVKISENRVDDVAPMSLINLEQPPVAVNTNNSNLSRQEVRVVVADVAVNANVNCGGSGATLYVGDLHWWTTDAELEAEMGKYGAVKEIRFFDEKASGKSKGYAHVEFFDEKAAVACKEGMTGFLFNGRACVVRRLGESQMNRTTNQAGQVRRDGPLGNKPMVGNNVAPVMSYQGGGGDNNNNNNNNYNNGGGFGNRGFGRGNWGRGNNGQGMGSRGGPIRNRPMMGGRGGMMGNGFSAGPPMLQPHFGGPMGSYGGFPGGPARPFTGMMPSFPPVAGVGLPGVSPHVNPAFFGRGMGMNGMGMMSSSGVEGNNMGMWGDQNMGGWGGEEHDGRVAESGYAEEADSDHHYGEVSRERGGAGRQNAIKEKERGSEREWSGASDKRYRDDRELEYEREIPREKEVSHDEEWQERRHRDDRDVSRERELDKTRERSRSRDRGGRDRYRGERERYADNNRYRDLEPEYDDEWEKGRSSRIHNKSRLSQEERQHFRSRDAADYSKRRRQTSE